MLLTIGSTLLLLSACAMLYQADEKRASFAIIRQSIRIRNYMRSTAGILLVTTLVLLAGIQGWERGIPVWLGIFSAVFVGGLFLAAQRPDWHGRVATGSFVIGLILSTVGAVL